MKLRVAEKVYGFVGTPDEKRYRRKTVKKAESVIWRYDCNAPSSKFMFNLFDWLGAGGRAELLDRLGEKASALRVLMESYDWNGSKRVVLTHHGKVVPQPNYERDR